MKGRLLKLESCSIKPTNPVDTISPLTEFKSVPRLEPSLMKQSSGFKQIVSSMVETVSLEGKSSSDKNHIQVVSQCSKHLMKFPDIPTLTLFLITVTAFIEIPCRSSVTGGVIQNYAMPFSSVISPGLCASLRASDTGPIFCLEKGRVVLNYTRNGYLRGIVNNLNSDFWRELRQQSLNGFPSARPVIR